MTASPLNLVALLVEFLVSLTSDYPFRIANPLRIAEPPIHQVIQPSICVTVHDSAAPRHGIPLLTISPRELRCSGDVDHATIRE
jgi:hypothetical protein